MIVNNVCRVIVKASGVTSNESAMTGESDEPKKEGLDVCK